MIDGRRRSAPAAPGTPAESPAAPAAGGETDARAPSRAAPDRTTWLRPGPKLVELGVRADVVTVVGMLLAVCTAFAIGRGLLYLGVALITVGGLMDFLDGAVAKAAGTASKRGAFFDSVSDRVADALILGGVAWYLLTGHSPKLALLPFAILGVSTIVSYERAKAESLGFTAKGGLMERAERLILLSIGLFFHVVLVPVLWILLVLTAGTAAGRFLRVWRQANGATTPDLGVLARSWRPARVESRWRAWRETGRVIGRGPGRVAHGTGWSRRRPDDVGTWSTRRRVGEEARTASAARRAGGRASTRPQGARARRGFPAGR